MNKILPFLLSFIILLGVANLVFAAAITLPNPLCPVDNNGQPVNAANCVNDFPTLITKVSDFIMSVIGILATLMFVVAGILFVSSAGNPGRIDQAKKMALYAAIGIAIAILGKGLTTVIVSVIGTPPA